LKKNNFLLLLLSLFFITFSFAEEIKSTESDLYSEITSAYASKSYPAVVEYTAQFESIFSSSLLTAQVMSYKGESLFKLGRLEEAASTLDKAISIGKDSADILIPSLYWKGRVEYSKAYDSNINETQKKLYKNALEYFNGSCVVYKKNSSQNNSKYNYKSIFYSAKCFYNIELYENAVPLLEYIVANGNNYSSIDYSDSILTLFNSYSKTSNDNKLISLFENLPASSDQILSEVYDSLCLIAGTSYEKLSQYKKAYACYSKVLTSGKPELASVALQKAYIVSSRHQVEVGQDSGTVLANAKDSLVEYPQLVSQFWTRLGIDSYNENDYSKAISYFDNAEKDCSREYKILIGLYRSEISFKTEKSLDKAISLLDEYSKSANLTSEDDLYLDYESLYTKYFALKEDWKSTKEKAQSVLNLSSKKSILYKRDYGKIKNEATYYYALASYKTDDYKKSVELLSSLSENELSENYEEQILYAQSLSKADSSSMALEIYKSLDEKKLLKENDRLDYAKLLLSLGYMKSAYEQSAQVNSAEGWYLTGVASFNRKIWMTAEQNFKKYISSSDAQKKYLSYAEFYCGYSQYRLGKTNEAYNTLTSFTKKNPSHELAWNACTTAASSAVQNNKYDLAAVQAEKAIEVSADEEKKQQSIILCANIYADSGNYSKAVSTLAPYAKQSNDFGVLTRYQTAQIYAKQGDYDSSDKLYGQIAENFKANSLADDASYRRGELYYNAKNYNNAVLRFDTYRSQFPSGKFIDASYFYGADSYSELNQTDKAILMYLTLIGTVPNSSYVYSSKKNLVQLYTKQNEYSDALEVAKSLQKDYSTQAEKEGISLKISELEKLASGEDTRIVKQRIEYEKNGGISTIEGRVAGTKLVSMLWSSSETQSEAVEIANQLVPLQTSKKNETTECVYAAQNIYILAQNERQQNKNTTAAEKYLSAAEYARMSQNDLLAQKSLYGAVDSFNADGKKGDAKNVLKTLQQLYPLSDFTTKATSLLK